MGMGYCVVYAFKRYFCAKSRREKCGAEGLTLALAALDRHPACERRWLWPIRAFDFDPLVARRGRVGAEHRVARQPLARSYGCAGADLLHDEMASVCDRQVGLVLLCLRSRTNRKYK